jgi:hypothetical protein
MKQGLRHEARLDALSRKQKTHDNNQPWIQHPEIRTPNRQAAAALRVC